MPNIHEQAIKHRENHGAQMKAAVELVESIPDWKAKKREYKRLSKISCKYYVKPKAQQELEDKMAKIQLALKDSEPTETK